MGFDVLLDGWLPLSRAAGAGSALAWLAGAIYGVQLRGDDPLHDESVGAGTELCSMDGDLDRHASHCIWHLLGSERLHEPLAQGCSIGRNGTRYGRCSMKGPNITRTGWILSLGFFLVCLAIIIEMS